MSLTSTATAQRVKPVKPVPTDAVPGFDTSKFRLGSLCQRGHDYHGSGMSLRYRCSRACRDCRKAPENKARKNKLRRERYHTDPEYRASIKEDRKAPKNKARTNQRKRERYHTDPKYRASIREYQQDARVKANTRDRQRERYHTDPEYRDRIRQRQLKRYHEARQALLAERARQRSQPDPAEPDRPAPSAAERAVTIGPDGSLLIRGVPKPLRTPQQREIIKALVRARDEGKEGLHLPELQKLCPSAAGVIRWLQKSDPDLRSVLHRAGRKGGIYWID